MSRCRARARCYLAAGFILEEGFPLADLERIVDLDGHGGDAPPACRS